MNLKLNQLDWSFLFGGNLLAVASWNTKFLNILHCFFFLLLLTKPCAVSD